MHRARAFFYVCAGIFLLALSYHLGGRSATAQSVAPVVGISQSGTALAVVTSTGDVYTNFACSSLSFCSNIFGSPTPVQRESFGSVKARYR